MILGFAFFFFFLIETHYLRNGISFIIQNNNKYDIGKKIKPF